MDLVGDAAGIGGDGGVDLGAVNTLKDFHVAPEADILASQTSRQTLKVSC